jgi:glutamyl-tRNA reductase
VARKRRTAKNAQRVEIYLTPAETVALKQIEALRQHRQEERDSPSEIVSDALWRFLEEVEHIPREEIERRFPQPADEAKKSNVTKFPKKNGDHSGN